MFGVDYSHYVFNTRNAPLYMVNIYTSKGISK